MSDSHDPETIILITGDGIGQAEPELRRKLIGIYLKMLLENGLIPKAICFYGEGVKLVVEGSLVLSPLKQLEEKGVLLLSCVTCINYFNLADKVAVGILAGMHDIVAAQWQARKVITL